jgi:tRNA threonylcarbamoyl adenosine modification protein (Sua5/YciO/YrdC/YwlC family)
LSAIDDAAVAVRDGSLVVFPTDTVYGIGSRPDVPQATRRLFEAKGRPTELELPVLASSRVELERVAVFDERALLLTDRFWPGPLTLILPRGEESRGWDLGGDPSTVGVRIPRHRLASLVLEVTGPMAVTSANLSGKPPLTKAEELVACFGEAVAVYICEERPVPGIASTVADLAHGPMRLIREGVVLESALLDAMNVG